MPDTNNNAPTSDSDIHLLVTSDRRSEMDEEEQQQPIPSTSSQSSTMPTSQQSQDSFKLNSSKVIYYKRQLQGMKHDAISTLFVDYMHVMHHNELLANTIVDGYYRYEYKA